MSDLGSVWEDDTLRPGFRLPDSWDYADDQVPQWYQLWEQEGRI